MQTGSGKPVGHAGGTCKSHIYSSRMDDEIELVFLGRKPSPSPTGTRGGTETQDSKDAVTVTTNVTVTREVI
jgi:hypothetical protein